MFCGVLVRLRSGDDIAFLSVCGCFGKALKYEKELKRYTMSEAVMISCFQVLVLLMKEKREQRRDDSRGEALYTVPDTSQLPAFSSPPKSKVLCLLWI